MNRMPSWLEQHLTPEQEFARKVLTEAAQPILILESICILRREFDRLIDLAVADCRAEGRSWAEIGEALEVTRQAARRRFMHLDQPGA